MPNACFEVFRYAAGFVSADDITAFAPADPGYQDYVRAFGRILSTGELPIRADFDITETIGLTRWHKAEWEKEPARFRRFRTFTNAVGVALCTAGIVADDEMPGNYLAISLLDDTCALGDRELLRLLTPAFEELHQALQARDCEESPFVLLAILLCKAQLGSPVQELADIAGHIFAEETKYFGHASSDFLWGCTCFDQLHERWRAAVARVLEPTTPSLAELREALLPDSAR